MISKKTLGFVFARVRYADESNAKYCSLSFEDEMFGKVHKVSVKQPKGSTTNLSSHLETYHPSALQLLQEYVLGSCYMCLKDSDPSCILRCKGQDFHYDTVVTLIEAFLAKNKRRESTQRTLSVVMDPSSAARKLNILSMWACACNIPIHAIQHDLFDLFLQEVNSCTRYARTNLAVLTLIQFYF